MSHRSASPPSRTWLVGIALSVFAAACSSSSGGSGAGAGSTGGASASGGAGGAQTLGGAGGEGGVGGSVASTGQGGAGGQGGTGGHGGIGGQGGQGGTGGEGGAPAVPPLDCAWAQANPIPIALGDDFFVPSSPTPASTVGADDEAHGSCMDGPDPLFPTPDAVYQIVPQADGTLHARVGENQNLMSCAGPPSDCWDMALYAQLGPCAAGAELACSDTYGPSNGYLGNWWDPEEIAVPVTAGTGVFVFVDSKDTIGGIYYLRLWLTP